VKDEHEKRGCEEWRMISLTCCASFASPLLRSQLPSSCCPLAPRRVEGEREKRETKGRVKRWVLLRKGSTEYGVRGRANNLKT
jgi:hypothetical protein